MKSEAVVTQVHLVDLAPRPQILQGWEKQRRGRALWVVQFIAEAFATFLYTYAGTGSTASYILGNLIGLAGLGSLFQIGVAYAIGIVLALVVCLPTSKGHANPAFTICAALRGHCTPLRALMLLVAQILGAYIACLLIYTQYHNLISEAVTALKAKGVYDELMFTTSGPGGIFGLYAQPGANLGYIFLNEFVCDFVLAVVIFAVVEPTNIFAPPALAPWIIGFTYAIVIWGYVPVGLAANSARDIGGRLAAMTFWGLQASGGKYAAISALTNITATVAGGIFYEFILNDASRTVTRAHLEIITAEKAYEEHVQGASTSSLDTSSIKEVGLPA